MQTSYRLFGFNLATDLPLTGQLAPAHGNPDLELTRGAAPPAAGWTRTAPAYVSPYRTESGEPASRLFRLGGRDVLCFPGTADFSIEPGRITVHAPGGDDAGIGSCLLGPVASYWLERRGLPVLHASAVAWGGAAVGFLAECGGGKSGLAAALVAEGYPLVTDDLLAVERRQGELLARPGLPQLRLWPDAAPLVAAAGPWEELPRIEPGSEKRRVRVGPGGLGRFHGEPLPLAGLYLLARRGGAADGVEISELPRGQALIELVRHSFAPYLVESVGLQPGRLDVLAELVRRVPVRRLAVPDGLGRLPETVEALRCDLAALLDRPL